MAVWGRLLLTPTLDGVSVGKPNEVVCNAPIRAKCIYVCMHACERTRGVCAFMRACVCACVRACVRAFLRACVRACARTHATLRQIHVVFFSDPCRFFFRSMSFSTLIVLGCSGSLRLVHTCTTRRCIAWRPYHVADTRTHMLAHTHVCRFE